MKRYAHAPAHMTDTPGTYIVTCGTYLKEHHFLTADRLDCVCSHLRDLAERYGWKLEAWAVFSNHFHIVAESPEDPGNLGRFMGHLHTVTSTFVNKLDGTPGRQVWYQFRETLLDGEKAYYTRLHYVLENPVRHGLVARAQDYPWCSTRAFLAHAPAPKRMTVLSFKTDRVMVEDAYEPVMPEAQGIKLPGR